MLKPNARQQQLLAYIVEEYIKTAQPVSSKLLGEAHRLDWSSATIRNEMAVLEELGLLYQPHTSAGRVPTEQAYRMYVDQSAGMCELSIEERNRLQNIVETDSRRKMKELAKQVADISGEAVMVGFDTDDLYYTGLSNLFSKPELAHLHLVVNMSQLLDHLDTISLDLSGQANDEVLLLIGTKSPFGPHCSVVFSRCGKQSALFAVFGMLRMDYLKNKLLVQEVKTILQNMSG